MNWFMFVVSVGAVLGVKNFYGIQYGFLWVFDLTTLCCLRWQTMQSYLVWTKGKCNKSINSANL